MVDISETLSHIKDSKPHKLLNHVYEPEMKADKKGLYTTYNDEYEQSVLPRECEDCQQDFKHEDKVYISVEGSKLRVRCEPCQNKRAVANKI